METEKTEAIHYCPECKIPLLNSPSGAICVDGHLGIHPKVPPKINQKAKILLARRSLPKAKQLPFCLTDPKKAGAISRDLFMVEGRPGVYFRVRRTATEWTGKDQLMAFDGKVLALKRSEEVEIALMLCKNSQEKKDGGNEAKHQSVDNGSGGPDGGSRERQDT